MASLIIEVQPTNEPVTVTEAMSFARETDTNNTPLFAIMVKAAREACEVFTARSFCYKGYRQGLDSFPYFVDTVMSQMAFPPSYYSLPRYSTTLWNYSQMIKLFRPPLVRVDRLTYLAASDNQYHDLVPTPDLWYPTTATLVNGLVMDVNANVQKCTVAGTTMADPPVWSKVLNGVTAEGGSGPTWQNMGRLQTTRCWVRPASSGSLLPISTANRHGSSPDLRAASGRLCFTCRTLCRFTLRQATALTAARYPAQSRWPSYNVWPTGTKIVRRQWLVVCRSFRITAKCYCGHTALWICSRLVVESTSACLAGFCICAFRVQENPWRLP